MKANKSKEKLIQALRDRQNGTGQCIAYLSNDDWHKVEKVDGDYVITACGIATTLFESQDNKEVTCRQCQQSKIVILKDNKVYCNDDLLFTGEDAKEARYWCYRQGAIGFNVHYGVVSTKIFYKEEVLS